jgi:hypothetical protein
MKSPGSPRRHAVSPPVGHRALLVSLVFGMLASSGCRDVDVVTESYATLAEATAARAIERGWIPRGLPPGALEIREAHDLDSNRRWGVFSFPQNEADALRGTLGAELSLAGHTCNPPRRIEWWPVLLRERLDAERITATGLRAYQAREGGLIFAVNWNQGRAYYWTLE